MTVDAHDAANPLSLEELTDSFVLNRIDARELPKLALDLVLAGSPSPWIAALARAGKGESSFDLSELFERALRDLNVAMPCRIDAAFRVRNRLARDVVTGKLTVEAGATALRFLDLETTDDFPPTRAPVGKNLGIASILANYFQLLYLGPENESERAILETDIRNECKALIEPTARNR